MGLEESRAPQQPPSRIIIVDDHPLFRSAIRQTLEKHSDLEVVGEAANGYQALELCRRLRPELVLMDLRMPEMDGIEATHAIKREFFEILVLILTALDESKGLSDSLEAGAAGYILKHASPDQITLAVRRVLAGETPLDDEVSMRLLMSLMDRGRAQKEEGGPAVSSTSGKPLGERGQSYLASSLTPREVEILRLIARGQTNQQNQRQARGFRPRAGSRAGHRTRAAR
jgi:DNA-binding NarL/FixJ family response regulator